MTAVRSHRKHPTVLPLSMASLGNQKAPADPVPTLTTLTVNERCDNCDWPETCAQDQTCWRRETGQPWQRTRLDLGTSRTTFRWTPDLLIEWVHEFVRDHGRSPHSQDPGPKHWTIRNQGFKSLADLVRNAGHEPHRKARGRWKR